MRKAEPDSVLECGGSTPLSISNVTGHRCAVNRPKPKAASSHRTPKRLSASLRLCVVAFFLSSLSLFASEYTFRNHVQPILAKTGCSAGACHGAAAGQNGFRLSLRGYDDEGDYLSLTRHALGRRIIPADPARSLLLLKPTGAVPHKGGTRFETNSLEYQILADWIASGAPGPKQEDPRIERIEITPKQVTLKPTDSQQFAVKAPSSTMAIPKT